MREGVAVWPARDERIMGRLSLIMQHSVLFLAWLPYSQGQLRKDGTFLGSSGDSSPSVQSRGQVYVPPGWIVLPLVGLSPLIPCMGLTIWQALKAALPGPGVLERIKQLRC